MRPHSPPSCCRPLSRARGGAATRLLFVVGVVLPVAGAAAAAVLLAAALDSGPAVVGAGWPAAARERPLDLGRATVLLRRHDPRRLLPGQSGSLALTPTELQWLLDQAAARAGRPAAARLALGAKTATLTLSVLRPPLPLLGSRFGEWVNLRARIDETDGRPVLGAVRVGAVPVPAPLAALVLQQAMARGDRDLAALAGVVQRVRLSPDGLQLDYLWGADSARQLVGALLPPAEEARLAVYSAQLHEAAAAGRGGWSLAEVLPPLFRLARARSTDDATALLENRAALRALAFYATGRELPTGGAAGRPAPPPSRTLLLHGRDDWPLHLLVSATVAAEGGGPLADAIGVYKELRDARAGSGFSFNDLAADRAGTRLGLLAAQSPRELQARLAAGVDEHGLLPDIADLPEFLPEAEFRRRYGGIGAPAYAAVLADIERRLDTLPLLR